MNISKLIFAFIFTLAFTFSSFATNAVEINKEFTATFSAKVDNKATTNITNNKGTVIVTLTNEQGNILQERTITAENIKYTISLENLPKGTYFLQVRGTNPDTATYQTYQVN